MTACAFKQAGPECMTLLFVTSLFFAQKSGVKLEPMMILIFLFSSSALVLSPPPISTPHLLLSTPLQILPNPSSHSLPISLSYYYQSRNYHGISEIILIPDPPDQKMYATSVKGAKVVKLTPSNSAALTW